MAKKTIPIPIPTIDLITYPYSAASKDPIFLNYITNKKGKGGVDFLNTNHPYSNIVNKLRAGTPFSSSDIADLELFTTNVDNIVHCTNFINNFKQTKSLNLAALFNQIAGIGNYQSFLQSNTISFTANQNKALPYLFSIIKHCQNPDSYPIRYKQWVNLNEHCKWSNNGADEYERLCSLYNILPLTGTPRHLHFAAYMDYLAHQLMNKIAPQINNYPKTKLLNLFNTYKKEIGILLAGKNNNPYNTPPTPVPSHPLNLILYGPPGTGKTYNTIAHAIAICDGVDSKKYGIDFDNKTNVPIIKDFELAKERYDTLKDAGQIVFTTFHQSMSYEDFIEGIRPEIYYNPSTKEKSILYNKKNGIFKDICETADENRLQAQKKPSAISHRYIQNLVDAFFDPLTIKKGSLTISYGKKTYQISRNSSTSYTVQLTPSVTRNLTLGIVERDYENFKNGNIKTYKDIKPSRTSKIPVHDNARLYWGLYQELQKFEDINKSIIDLGEKTEEPLKNFVLIIDEINRGNVAQIFGELITLIEPSKRLGEKEYLTAQLPYSSSMTSDDDVEEFGVPNNLYIIGTMNTADRSVEALDTALRRRFSFEEMMPDPELLKDDNDQFIEVCGVKLSELLKTINDRIVALKDREHQIGHSYFMGCETEDDLKNVFKDKIIPLLQEYFYGDYKKIYYVLGPGFVEKKTGKTIFAVDVTNDGFDFDIPEEKYEIKTESFDIQQAIKDFKVQS